MEKEKTSQEESNEFFSGVTDYYFFEKTDGMSQDDYSYYIRKNLRQNKISLIFESYSWFFIYGCLFGGLLFGTGMALFTHPKSLQERELIAIPVISVGIALISISFIVSTYIMVNSAKLFRYFKNEDLNALYAAFVENNNQRKSLKHQRKDYAKWAIIYLVKNKDG
ncbi:MAG: hypothetical protein ACTSSB_09075 [Candidatus Heimdallarchaeota archaeon]